MHDIDDVFRSRFDGLKDHTVDPASQWAAVEQSIGSLGTSSVAVGGATGSSFWSIAASVAGVAVVSAVATMDAPKPLLLERSVGITELPVGSADKGSAVITPMSWEEASSSAMSTASFITPSMQLPSASQNQAYLVATVESDQGSPSQVEGDGWAEHGQTPASAYGQEFVATTRENRLVRKMDRLKLEAHEAALLDRAQLAIPSIEVASAANTGIFLRAGVRVGSGESNSIHKPAQWRVNNVLSIGYAFPISSNTSVSLEVGHLRRSGNGIERYKEVDFAPIIGVLANNYDQGATSGVVNDLENIHESLVATTMDYIQMPLQFNLDLNATSKTSIGFFADYLIRLKNETYMVYNSRDYISANFGMNDKNSIEGMKRLRFGMMAGYQHKLSDRLSADVRGMLPITSQYDGKSEYNIHGEEPSQLVDFQFALIYRI